MVVARLGFSIFMAVARDQSLARERRSHIKPQHIEAEKKKRGKGKVTRRKIAQSPLPKKRKTLCFKGGCMQLRGQLGICITAELSVLELL